MDKMETKYQGIPHRAHYKEQIQKTKQNVKENSGEIAAGGAVGTATFSAMRNSTRIGNSTIELIKNSRVIQQSNKAKIINILGKGKFMTNPVVQKIAGVFAGFAAISTVTASALKIADTCQYLDNQAQTQQKNTVAVA